MAIFLPWDENHNFSPPFGKICFSHVPHWGNQPKASFQPSPVFDDKFFWIKVEHRDQDENDEDPMAPLAGFCDPCSLSTVLDRAEYPDNKGCPNCSANYTLRSLCPVCPCLRHHSIVLLPKAPFAKAPGVLMPPPKAPGVDSRGDTSSEEEAARPTRDGTLRSESSKLHLPCSSAPAKKECYSSYVSYEANSKLKGFMRMASSVSSSTLTLGRLFPNTVSSECTRAQRLRC